MSNYKFILRHYNVGGEVWKTDIIATWRNCKNVQCPISYAEGYINGMLRCKRGLTLQTPHVKQIDGYWWNKETRTHEIIDQWCLVDENDNIVTTQ